MDTFKPRVDDHRVLLATERLSVRTLAHDEFKDYLYRRDAFAAAANLAKVPESLPLETENALRWLFEEGTRRSESLDPWQTLWGIFTRDGISAFDDALAETPRRRHASTTSRLFLGSICFKSPPEEGVAEIAYTTETLFRGLGVMTEALRALVEWVASRDELQAITAETEFANRASQRVLKKLGFRRTLDAPFTLVDSFYWRLELDNATSTNHSSSRRN